MISNWINRAILWRISIPHNASISPGEDFLPPSFAILSCLIWLWCRLGGMLLWRHQEVIFIPTPRVQLEQFHSMRLLSQTVLLWNGHAVGEGWEFGDGLFLLPWVTSDPVLILNEKRSLVSFKANSEGWIVLSVRNACLENRLRRFVRTVEVWSYQWRGLSTGLCLHSTCLQCEGAHGGQRRVFIGERLLI